MTRIAACGDWSGERAEALRELCSEGFTLEACGEGVGPLECVIQRPPDVLLFATNERRRWEEGALHLVRRIHPRLPIVVVSSDGSVEERLRLSEVRPSYVAVDPIELNELVEAVRALVGRRSSRRATAGRRAARGSRVGHTPSAG